MKVVRADNFDLGRFPESLVAEGLERVAAHALADALNARTGKNSQFFYKVVDDDYVLFAGVEP